MSHTLVLALPGPAGAPAVRALLAETGGFTVAAEATTSSELLAVARDREPDAVLLHESVGPAPALTTVRELVLRMPALAVLLVVREATPEVLAAALDAGARGVLTTPLSYTDVTGRLAAAARWSRRARHPMRFDGALGSAGSGRVVVVAGAKGGTGATLVAGELALAAAAVPGRRVCVVDLDLAAGDLGVLLDVPPARGIADLVDVAEELTPQHLDDVLYVHRGGLRVLLPPAHGEQAETVTGAVARRVLGVLRSAFDLVVVDVGTAVDERTAAAVEVADRMLLLSTPDVLALRAANRVVELWDRLRVRPPAEVHVVLNRTSRDVLVQPATARRVLLSPLSPVTLPAAFRALEPVANAGATARRPAGPWAAALRRLAVDVGAVDPPVSAPLLGGVLAWVRRRTAPAPLVDGPAAPEPAVPAAPAPVPADRGAATVETVGVLGVLAVVLLAALQLLLLGATVLAADVAAERAAADLSAGVPPAAARDGLRADLPVVWRQARVVVERRDPAVADDVDEVVVGLDVPSLVPHLVPPVAVERRAVVVPPLPAEDPPPAEQP